MQQRKHHGQTALGLRESLERRGAYRLLGETLRPYRRRLVAGAASMTVATAAVLAVPYLVKYGIDSGISHSDTAALWRAVTLIGVAGVVAAIFQSASLRLFGKAGECAIADLRNRLWCHVQSLSIDRLSSEGSGQLISRMTNDIEAVHGLLRAALITIVPNLLLMAGIIVGIFLLDSVIACIVMGTIVPAVILTIWTFSVRSRRAYRGVRESLAQVVDHLAETLRGIKATRRDT